MPPWKKELDTLVEQTLTFIGTMKGRTVWAEPSAEPALLVTEQAIRAEPAPPKAPLAPMTWLLSEREEITQRVKNFKAHQQKLQNERDEFFQRTMANARAQLQPGSGDHG